MSTDKQFHKFLIAGIINTVFFYTLYALLIYLEYSYYVAIIGANSVGIIFSFKNFGIRVFDLNDNRLIWRFIVAYLFLVSFYMIIVSLFRMIEINDYIAGLFGLIPYILISFLVNRNFVYIKD